VSECGFVEKNNHNNVVSDQSPKTQGKARKMDFFAIEKLYAEGRDLFLQGKHEEAMAASSEATRRRWIFGAIAGLWTTTTQERKTSG
jgi:hypothetical protein